MKKENNFMKQKEKSKEWIDYIKKCEKELDLMDHKAIKESWLKLRYDYQAMIENISFMNYRYNEVIRCLPLTSDIVLKEKEEYKKFWELLEWAEKQ